MGVGKQPVLTNKEKASGLMHGTDWVPMTDADIQSKLYRPLQNNLGHMIDKVAQVMIN